jgi:hypothetical protein
MLGTSFGFSGTLPYSLEPYIKLKPGAEVLMRRKTPPRRAAKRDESGARFGGGFEFSLSPHKLPSWLSCYRSHC